MTRLPAPTTLASTPAVRPRRSVDWPVALVLAGLSAIPVTAGVLRLVQLSGGPAAVPADPRYGVLPVALVGHIVGSAVFALLGVLQLLPAFRKRHLTWHRMAGRALAVAGLAVAASALWMTLTYPAKPGTTVLLYVLRLAFGSALAASLVLAVRAVRRRDIPAHRAWMIRAYAIAVAAGTQAFTEGLNQAFPGSGPIRDDLAKGAGWVTNLAIAEWAIRRRPAPAPSIRRLP